VDSEISGAEAVVMSTPTQAMVSDFYSKKIN
jgi:hypothetical protein